ncbi:MAG: hypothetical protein LRY73_10140 [Bacillus sp. (in: Bacteria)]|nr:hypothetical protein [Bacillus sp. (in: firmicutes)]
MAIELFFFLVLIAAVLVTGLVLVFKQGGRRLKLFLLAIPVVAVIGFSLTYIPHSVVSMEPANVSKITIFDGSTGYDLEITDEAVIHQIITNLNDIIFQKGKSSFFRMGYSFRTTIYDQSGKARQELIINSEDTIRYKGFFYTAKDNEIDYQFIRDLVDEVSK